METKHRYLEILEVILWIGSLEHWYLKQLSWLLSATSLYVEVKISKRIDSEEIGDWPYNAKLMTNYLCFCKTITCTYENSLVITMQIQLSRKCNNPSKPLSVSNKEILGKLILLRGNCTENQSWAIFVLSENHQHCFGK